MSTLIYEASAPAGLRQHFNPPVKFIVLDVFPDLLLSFTFFLVSIVAKINNYR